MNSKNQYPSDAELLKFVDYIEHQEMQRAPANLKESIMSRTDSIGVKAEVKKKELSKNLQLFFYSMKVCVAIACAFLLLNLSNRASAIITNQREPLLTKQADVISLIDEQDNRLTNKLRGITGKIMDFEIKGYDTWQNGDYYE